MKLFLRVIFAVGLVAFFVTQANEDRSRVESSGSFQPFNNEQGTGTAQQEAETGLVRPSEDAKLQASRVVRQGETHPRLNDVNHAPAFGLRVDIRGTSEKIGELFAENNHTCWDKNGCGQLTIRVPLGTEETTLAEKEDPNSYIENDVPYQGTMTMQAYERIELIHYDAFWVPWVGDERKIGSGTMERVMEKNVRIVKWRDYEK